MNAQSSAANTPSKIGRPYTGFDKNDYPGDDLLPALRRSFAFAGYWLNDPPGMTSNPWVGKRSVIRAEGFGFLLLFNGRLFADLKGRDPAALGLSDAAAAIKAVRQEGFHPGAIIFLDQEEGGHLLPEQSNYLFHWIDAVQRSSFRAGVYCSGIAAGATDSATTASDILEHYAAGANRQPSGTHRVPTLWVSRDECPPARGCVVARPSAPPAASGFPSAAVWQYAQSPRRAQFTASCAASYSSDNGCYAPTIAHSSKSAIDLDTATSSDPSHGR